MKLAIVMTGAVAFGMIAEAAVAACSAPAASQVRHNTSPSLSALLSGNTVCAARGGDRWQEEHHTNGQLWDYKKGDGDAIDPRKQIGIWTVTGRGANTVVNYNYGGAQYSYEVWDNGGGSYSFCQGGSISLDAAVLTGINMGCP